VISIVRHGDTAKVGSLTSAEVDQSAIEGLVAASQAAAASAPEARDAAPLLSGNSAPADWDAPIPATGPEVFSDIAGPLAGGFRGADRLYGFAQHAVETTFLATSSGLRRRYTQPTGSVEINAKRDGASAWVGVGTPDFAGVPTDSLLEQSVDAVGLGQARRRVACRALRDHPAAVGSGRHDGLPRLVDERPRRAGGPHRIFHARRRNSVGGEADRAAADAVLRSHGVRAGLYALCGDHEFVGNAVDLRQRDGHRTGGLDSPTGSLLRCPVPGIRPSWPGCR
jgi:hypothetical protein